MSNGFGGNERFNRNKQKKRLFQEDDNSDLNLTINKKYAKTYHKEKTAKELTQLSQKYEKSTDSRKNPKNPTNFRNSVHTTENSGESSSSSEEDEEGVLAEDMVEDFLGLVPRIAARDKALKNSTTRFFQKLNDEGSEDEEEEKGAGDRKKPYTYKDMIRDEILNEMDNSDSQQQPSLTQQKQGLSIAQEELFAKEEFLKASKIEEENSEEIDLLKKKKKTSQQKEEEENEYKEFLKQRKQMPDKGGKLLEKYWLGEETNENEKFLRNFIISKGWVDSDKDRIPTYEELVNENDDEDFEALEKQEQFEAVYNFRFEEPDATRIALHQRNPSESVRRPDERRKKKRARKKEKKEKLGKKKEDEKNRLKKLKTMQITERLKTIQEISGTNDESLKNVNLEEDFDPEKYDKEMNKVFNENYYNTTPDTEKPFEGDEDVLNHNPKIDDYIEKNGEQLRAGDKKLDQYLNEYYQLEYEDLIHDVPCRFKYTQVKPINYCLDSKTILETDDNELKKIVPLRRLMPYRTDQGMYYPQRFLGGRGRGKGRGEGKRHRGGRGGVSNKSKK